MSKRMELLWKRTIEDGDCILWTGKHSKGIPRFSVREGDKATTAMPRRLVWEDKNGPIPKGKYVTVTCGHPGCLAHLKLTTKAAISRKVGARPDVKIKRSIAGKRSRTIPPKLSDDQVRYIRQSEKTGADLARELGLGYTLVNAVKRGVRYRDLSNPFAGLL